MKPLAALACSFLNAALFALPMAAPVRAAKYEWLGGPFSTSGVPNPLSSSDTAEMHDPSGAPTFDVGFVNNSTFSYRHSNIVFAHGVSVINEGTWTSLDDHGLLTTSVNPPNVPKFINNGTFEARGGPTLIVNLDFTNKGIIRADTGLIGLNSPFKTFNEGTQFRGNGSIQINNGGRFNGGFNSDNLELRHGEYTGNDARIRTGPVRWTSGVFLGSWTNEDVLIAQDTGGVRQWGEKVLFTNGGDFLWQSGEMTLGAGAQIVNTGLYSAWPLQGTAFNWNNAGDIRPLFINRGRFTKRPEPVAAPPEGQDPEPPKIGTLHIGDIHFENHRTIEVPRAGDVINFNGPATFENGSRFEGNGTVRVSHDATFRGEFTSGQAVLQLASGRFTGRSVRMNGGVQWLGGSLADTWTNLGELSLLKNDAGQASKVVEGAFVNEGVMSWRGLSDALQLGGSAVFENRKTFLVNAGLPETQDKEFRRQGGGQPKFVNHGDFTHSGPGTTSFLLAYENLGHINVEDGTLRFREALVQNGHIRGSVSAILSVPDPTDNFGLVEGFKTIQGRLVNRGHHHPGFSPGTLLLEGGYTHGVEGVLHIELEGTASFDRLIVEGTADLLGGELALHCFGLCDLAVGDRFDFLEASGELTGAFDSLTLPGFGEGWLFDLEYDYDADRASLEVLQVGVPEPSAFLLAGLALAWLLLTRGRPTMPVT